MSLGWDYLVVVEFYQLGLGVLITTLWLMLHGIASWLSVSIFSKSDVFSLGDQEVTPASHDQLTVDIVLRRVNLVGVLLQLVHIDLAQCLFAHLASSLEKFTYWGNVLIQWRNAIDEWTELGLVVSLIRAVVLLVHYFFDGTMNSILAHLVVQLLVLLWENFLCVETLLLNVSGLNDKTRHALQSVSKHENAKVVVRGYFKRRDKLPSVSDVFQDALLVCDELRLGLWKRNNKLL